MSQLFSDATTAVDLCSNFELRGTVADLAGLVIEGHGPIVPVGTQVTISSGNSCFEAQVVGFRRDKTLLMPYTELRGISPGAKIVAHGVNTEVLVSDALLGQVLDSMGRPIGGGDGLAVGAPMPLYAEPSNPVTRARISEPFDIGVRAINTMLTVGRGQRVGIMAGSGVGKSTLLGMIARNSTSDINVIALVGERGREVREFIERDLGEEGLKRSIVVVATGNESALCRIRAAFYATSIAEFYRDQGKDVVLMLDSVTRFAMAQREIGLAIGEPPSSKGYTPSVFSMLPKLLERAGTSEGKGTITGLYTVLVEGDDMNEPIADAVRGILDGHIVLSRDLAGKGHFPAIEMLESVSRVMPELLEPDYVNFANEVREIIATYRDAEDLITIGAYKPGQNPKVDRAVQYIDALNDFLKQKSTEKATFEESWNALVQIFKGTGQDQGAQV